MKKKTLGTENLLGRYFGIRFDINQKINLQNLNRYEYLF